jgi:hypothetical protein
VGLVPVPARRLRPAAVPGHGERSENVAGVLTDVASQQIVGSMRGLPVVTDPNIPVTQGPGNNEDPVFVVRASHLVLWEGGIRARVLPETKATTLTVLLQIYSYLAFRGQLPAERRRDHRPDSTDVLRTCCRTVTRSPAEPLQSAAIGRSTGPGNSAPRSRCKTWRLAEAQFRIAHKPSRRGYVIASAHSICPSKPSVFAMSR